MGLAKLKLKTSAEDYLEQEKISSVKHEYVDGAIYQMAGASDNHGRIVVNWTTYYFDEPEERAEFSSVELSVPLTEIYRRVKFEK